MSTVFDNIKSRTSTRSFQNKPIAADDLKKIIEAGTYAPSGMNRQSWQFTVLQQQAQMVTLAQAMRPILGRDQSYDFYKPVVLVLLSNEADNENGLADCSCALQNIFLMAEDLGIGSCWINQLKGICDEPGVRAVLKQFGVPDHHVVWGMAALGYAAQKASPKPRKEGTVVYVK